MTMRKPIPEALYPCKFCYDDLLWRATELYWSERAESWVCVDCWSHLDLAEQGEVGISLADEIKVQQDQRDWVDEQ
jgi:hypothetical protein